MNNALKLLSDSVQPGFNLFLYSQLLKSNALITEVRKEASSFNIGKHIAATQWPDMVVQLGAIILTLSFHLFKKK